MALDLDVAREKEVCPGDRSSLCVVKAFLLLRMQKRSEFRFTKLNTFSGAGTTPLAVRLARGRFFRGSKRRFFNHI